MLERNFKWYIVKCPSGVENKFVTEFRESLEKAKCLNYLEECFLPSMTQQKTTSRKSIMANYIFVKMIYNETVEKIFEKIKYASLMRDHSLKLVETDEETIQKLKEKDALEKERLAAKLEVGEAVKVLEAPFIDFEGHIEKIKESEQIASVCINILGNPIYIELPFNSIKRINNE